MIKIKSISEIDHLQKLSLSEFSYSRIDTYKQCPSKYFYTYIKKEPKVFGEAAVLRKHSPFSFGKCCKR